MSCNLITIQGGHKVSRPVRSLEEYLALRNQPQQLITLQQVRSGNQQAKSRLIQFNYSGHYPQGVVKGCKLPSAAFGFDLDDAGEFERVVQLLLKAPTPGPSPERMEGGGMCPTSQFERPSMAAQEGGLTALGTTAVQEGALTALGTELGLLMLERSARQGGHAVFRREMGKTILENQVRIAMALGCEMDTNAHDINRVYFTTSASPDDLLFVSPELFEDSYDEAEVMEEARVLEHREVYHLEVLPEGAHSSCKHFKVQAVKAQSAVMASPVNGQLAVNSAAGPVPTEADPPTPINSEALTAHGELTAKPLTYLGIEYSQIIKKCGTYPHFNRFDKI